MYFGVFKINKNLLYENYFFKKKKRKKKTN